MPALSETGADGSRILRRMTDPFDPQRTGPNSAARVSSRTGHAIADHLTARSHRLDALFERETGGQVIRIVKERLMIDYALIVLV